MNIEIDVSELVDFAENLSETTRFNGALYSASREVGDVLIKMLKTNTPVKTGKLRGGWGSYKVEKVKEGFLITVTNDVDYAKWVNDGHYSYNQYGGAYFVYNRTPKIAPEYGTNDDDTFVFGHFFVEITLWQLQNKRTLDKIIYEHLLKWWEGCFNG